MKARIPAFSFVRTCAAKSSTTSLCRTYTKIAKKVGCTFLCKNAVHLYVANKHRPLGLMNPIAWAELNLTTNLIIQILLLESYRSNTVQLNFFDCNWPIFDFIIEDGSIYRKIAILTLLGWLDLYVISFVITKRNRIPILIVNFN